MNFIDTHTHLFSEKFNEDRDEVVQRAIDAGVTKLLLPNIDIASIDAMHDLVKKFPNHCYAMMGLHPCSVTENWEADLSIIRTHLEEGNYCAVGEIGIDLYWDKTTLPFQQEAFKRQVEWAKEFNLPVAIHVRDAFDETFELLDELNDDALTGVFHCFTGNKEQAERVLAYGGFKLGIGGVLTFKNSGVDKVIAEIDPAHLILETDSPYLAPTPYRGKRNESEYLTAIADKLAKTLNMNIEDIADITTRNAHDLFKTIE